MRSAVVAVALTIPFASTPFEPMFGAADDAMAVDLRQDTLSGFARYVAATEARIHAEVSRMDGFLYIDRLPASRHSDVEGRLKRGETFMESLVTHDANGQEIDAPGGLIHHWIGATFIPGASIAQVLSLVQDYNRHAQVYAPEISQSRLISHHGNDFMIFYRFRKHKVVTVTLDTEHSVHYARLDDAHWWSESHSTKIAEVADAGKPSEDEKAIGHDSGFLWRLNSYWRFAERESGVYVECESISLTRDIPKGLGWLIGPMVNSIPRQSLEFTMTATRDAVKSREHVSSKVLNYDDRASLTDPSRSKSLIATRTSRFDAPQFQEATTPCLTPP